MRRSTIYLFVLGFAILMMAALVSDGLIVSAQNANSSTTTENANTAKPRTSGRRRGGRRTANANANEAATSEMQANENAGMANTNANTSRRGRRGRRGTKAAAAAAEATPAPAAGETMKAPRRTGRCDPTQQEQADLSGTYTGKINYPDAGLTGDATLTVTGNNFTVTAGSATQAGRITAVTTCGYTGATMMFGDLTPPTPSPNPPAALPAVSVRAKKVGDHMTLVTVPGEKRSFSFASAGASMRPRKHRPKAKTEAPPPPAATPPQ